MIRPLVLSLLLSLAATPSVAADTPAQAMPGTAAKAEASTPTLEIALLDGTPWKLADQRGKYVVVNFWATWCAPCIKEMPELAALDEKHDDVVVIGLAFEDSERAAIEAFLKKRPVSYPIAQVDVYSPPADFEVPRGLPMTYLIAPDGSVAHKIMGPVTGEDLEKAIAKHRGS